MTTPSKISGYGKGMAAPSEIITTIKNIVGLGAGIVGFSTLPATKYNEVALTMGIAGPSVIEVVVTVTSTVPALPGVVFMQNFAAVTPTGVYVNTQSVTNSPLLTVSLWVRAQDGSVNRSPDIIDLALPDTGTAGAFLEIGFLGFTDVGGQLGDGTHLFQFGTDTGAFSANATGHHIFFSADTNHAAGAKLVNLYIDGISSIDPANTIDSGPAFSINFNTLNFGIQDTLHFLNSIAHTDFHFTEVWVGMGQYVDPSQISKFRDPVTKLPVSLGSNGQLPTGTEPTYYLTGAGNAFGTNNGSGPVVSVQGSLQTGTFNTFIDQNPLTVLFADGSNGINGIFQNPCSASDSSLVTISMWVRTANSTFGASAFPNLLSIGLNNGTGAGNSILLGFINNGSFKDVSCFFSSATNPGTNQVQFGSSSGPFIDNTTGHHVFVSVDTNHAAGAKLLNLYVDGVNVKDPVNTLDSAAAFNISFNASNTRSFGLPDTDNFVHLVGSDLDYAEVWIGCGQYVDPSNISKFRDPVTGKPVNLGSSGQTPTGTSPTYYFKGPFSAFGTNLGTGGAVILNNVPAGGVSAIGDSTWNLTM